MSPNEKLVSQRVQILNTLKEKKSLTTIVDFGLNPKLNQRLLYENIICIERENFLDLPNDARLTFINGNYEDEVINFLRDNTCYTYFRFEVKEYLDGIGGIDSIPPSQWALREFVERQLPEEEVRKVNFETVKNTLFNSNLKNSYLVLWIRRPFSQEFKVFDVETGLELNYAN